MPTPQTAVYSALESVTGSTMRPLREGVRIGSASFTPLELFANGETGAWYDPSDLATMFQDTAATIPATEEGDHVALILDKSGNGYNAIQSVDSARPILKVDSGGQYFLKFAEEAHVRGLEAGPLPLESTNSVTIFTSLRKTEDTSTGMVLELSTNSDTTNGTFALVGPNTSNTATYRCYSRGTLQSSIITSSYPAPHTGVLTQLLSISAAFNMFRINGLEIATNDAYQGSGNYSNNKLYIGKRSNNQFPFRGRLYGLIVRGVLSTADEVLNTERYMADRIGMLL